MFSRLATSLLAVLMTSVTATAAFAQAAGGSGNSIGERLQAILSQNAQPLFILVAALCWAAGLYLLVSSLVKLAHAANGHGKHEMAEGMLKLFVGILIFAMPDVAGIGMNSMTGGALNIFGSSGDLAQVSQSLNLDSGNGSSTTTVGQFLSSAITGAGSPATPQDCISSKDGVTCMAQNIATNAVPLAIFTVLFFAFFGGLVMFATGLLAVAGAQLGQGRSTPPGWWAKMAIALLLINSPWLIYTFAYTVQGQGGVMTLNGFDAKSSMLSYTFAATQTGSTALATNLQKFQDLIKYCLTILAFFGVWAFFRGIFMAKATAEGKQTSTYGHALVFIVAGIMLANSKLSICSILYTFGGMGMTYGFCN